MSRAHASLASATGIAIIHHTTNGLHLSTPVGEPRISLSPPRLLYHMFMLHRLRSRYRAANSSSKALRSILQPCDPRGAVNIRPELAKHGAAGSTRVERLSQLLTDCNGNSQGMIANTLAGKPEPFFGFGKVTRAIAPYSGTLSRLVRSSI